VTTDRHNTRKAPRVYASVPREVYDRLQAIAAAADASIAEVVGQALARAVGLQGSSAAERVRILLEEEVLGA
jgi:hypothetical protein